MHIAFVTSNYPTPTRPETGTFVQQFVWAMARQGNRCSVINPVSVFDRRFGQYPRRLSCENAGKGREVEVHRPLFVSFSSRNLGWTHTGRWTQRSLIAVARHAVAALSSRPDLIYGHFLYHAGFAAVKVGDALGCPSVIGVGEDSPWTLEAYGKKTARRHFENGTHFLANSTPNKEMLVTLLGIVPERILMEPNRADPSRMYPREREEMRRKHGLDADAFVVAFVGANERRKGPERVVEAVEGLSGVQVLLIGRGTEALRSSRIARSGPVSHEVVPELLACADVFVLPTTSEGSCNAVVEAIACGIPIVTARGRHMDDIVDDEVAIRVDPMSVAEIRGAILSLKEDPARRRQMIESCLERGRRYDINERARRVTAWMEQLVGRERA